MVAPLKNNAIFLCPLKKSYFSSKPPQKLSKDQNYVDGEAPSEMTFVDPSENLVDGWGIGYKFK